MSEVTELLEHAEHTAHGGHGGGHGASHDPGTTKKIGLTMAILGVLLAFCAALVGGERTELVKTMVEQTQANSEEQAQSTKYRMLFSQLEQLRAIAPTDDQVHALHASLDQLHAGAQPAVADAVQGARIVGEGLSEMLTPTPQPLARLIGLVRKARHETGLAQSWTDSYNPAVRAHFESAEGFERAQLCAEVGIVLASIALLMGARRVWYGAIGLGACAAVLVGMTYGHLKTELHHAEAGIEHAQHAYVIVAGGTADTSDDEDTLRALEVDMPPELHAVAHPPGTDEPVGRAPGGEHSTEHSTEHSSSRP